MILNNFDGLKENYFSVIIIGSGPAGISTALKLEKYKIKTLIIEAGGLNLDYENNRNFLKGDTKVLGKNLSDLRARMFGGTTSLWGGYCNKFEKYQMNTWPISIEDLNKYENEGKKILGLKPFHTDFYLKKFSEDFNQYHIRFAKNIDFKESFYEKIKKSKNIFLSLNTSLLSFKGDNEKISHIECIKNNNKINLKSIFYVLAAGGMENSRLLLWSKFKNKHLFNNDLPIGNYYMDHPWHQPAEGFLSYSKTVDYFVKSGVSREFYVNCLPRIYLSPNKNFREKNDILNTGIYLRVQDNKYNENRDYLDKIVCMAPNFFKKNFERKNRKDFYKFIVNLHQEQEPILTNKILLGQKKDPNGIPLIDIKWLMSQKMKKTARESLIGLGNFLTDHDIGRVSIDDHIFEYDTFIQSFAGTHQLGGTRMGEDHKKSVVDKNLKVHFIKNLYVTGSSVFPTSGHNHPTFTIILLSLKLGDHIKKIL